MIEMFKIYIPTFEGDIINIKELKDLKNFVQSETFDILLIKIINKLLTIKNYEKLDLVKLFESCDLLNIDKVENGIYPIYKTLFTCILSGIEEQVINIKLTNGDIKEYQEIKTIQNNISNIDKYYSFRGLVSFTHQQHLEDILRLKYFKSSLKDFKEYLNLIKGELK